MEVEVIQEHDWINLAEDAHLICFDEVIHPMQQRVDYALICTKENDPVAYMTCRELDTSCVYWQYGGAFPNAKDTLYSFKAYKMFADWHKDRYDYISTLIWNDNIPMLKMAMKIGFKITGTRTFEGLVFVEHTIKVNKDKQGEI